MDKEPYLCACYSADGNQNGIPKENQDYCDVRHLSDGLALVVCDGAGSEQYTHSAQGARLVSRLALDFYERKWNPEKSFILQARRFVFDVQKALWDEADRLGIDAGELKLPLEKFSCTMAAVYIGVRGFYAMQIGDSYIFKRTHPESSFEVVLPGHRDESGGNATTFITDPNAVCLLQVVNESDFMPHMICLTSDWLKNMLFCSVIEGRERKRNAIRNDELLDRTVWMMRYGSQSEARAALKTYLEKPEVARIYSDDRTLVCAVRRDQCSLSRDKNDEKRQDGDGSLWEGYSIKPSMRCPYVRPENARICNTQICETMGLVWTKDRASQSGTSDCAKNPMPENPSANSPASARGQLDTDISGDRVLLPGESTCANVPSAPSSCQPSDAAQHTASINDPNSVSPTAAAFAKFPNTPVKEDVVPNGELPSRLNGISALCKAMTFKSLWFRLVLALVGAILTGVVLAWLLMRSPTVN